MWVTALAPAGVCAASLRDFPDKYDEYIKDSAAKHLPLVDWRLLYAQYYQESKMDPKAVSPVGASGVAQFMPRTWTEVSTTLKFGPYSNPFDPKLSIEAGAYYMKQQRYAWRNAPSERDRHSLAMAGYNAGLGNIRKASTRAGGSMVYANVAQQLPAVTGKHSKETLTYVHRIWRYYETLLVLGK